MDFMTRMPRAAPHKLGYSSLRVRLWNPVLNESRHADFAAARPLLSVVVPVYNEVDGLEELWRRVTAACGDAAVTSYELVLVNDGSTDGTLERAARIAAGDPHVTVLDLARNYGHQVALSAGLAFCRGGRVLVIDADLQDPPELLGPMMKKMDEGYDVVYCQRTQRSGESRFKLFTASMFYRLLRRLSDTHMVENAGDFRLMSRRAVDHLNTMPERVRFIRGMVSWIGLRQAAFPYEREARFAGATHYPLRRMLRLAVDAITSFSVVPLRLASALGMAFGVLGLLVLAYTLFAWAAGGAVHGWTSLAGLILILGSVQMFLLGIFGEYLGRVFIEVKRRPLYIVKDVITGSAAAAPAPQVGFPNTHGSAPSQ
jgi:dolichol-phosphate mannosyltransferase